ncbi:MAG: LON peptidase substrate-binding domain-containing protein [Burkholderiaceae bacterium]
MSTLTLPLFPLNTILFPDGLLHLQIFELRYLTMVKQCIANGTEFGVVAQTDSPKSDEPMANETFTRCGTSAKIVAHSAPMAGLLRIECVGTQRFEVVSSAQQKLGLWVAEVEPIAADQVVAVPAELEDTVTALRNVISTLQSRAAKPEHTPILPPHRFDDCGWVANRWCELIPMPADQQQGLLTLDNPLIRLELVQDMLLEQGLLT